MRTKIQGVVLAGIVVTVLLSAGCTTATMPDGGGLEVANSRYANYCVSERSTRNDVWWCYVVEPAVPEGRVCSCPATPYRPGFRDGLTVTGCRLCR